MQFPGKYRVCEAQKNPSGCDSSRLLRRPSSCLVVITCIKNSECVSGEVGDVSLEDLALWV